MKDFLSELAADFADAEFAHSYMQSHAVTRIAAQIHAIRKQRGWSQAELAEKAGIAQERVSKIESADFESVTMKTLHKFARAFDIDLRIAFESFSDGILDVAKLDAARLKVCSREVDLKRFSHYIDTGRWQSPVVVAPVSTSAVAPLRVQRVGAPSIVGVWQATPPAAMAGQNG